jgi:hypothetical protein
MFFGETETNHLIWNQTSCYRFTCERKNLLGLAVLAAVRELKEADREVDFFLTGELS